jgi:hypothetical protein
LIVDQPRRVEVWTEASDLMALAARIARAYGVPCVSASGWSGPVMPREAARRWAIDERPVELIYLGDLDHPDGIEIAERNIVTAEQVEAWAILSEAGRTSHRNDVTMPVVAQAEAIPPARLRELLVAEIEDVLDLDVFAETRRRWAGEGSGLTNCCRGSYPRSSGGRSPPAASSASASRPTASERGVDRAELRPPVRGLRERLDSLGAPGARSRTASSSEAAASSTAGAAHLPSCSNSSRSW